MNIEARQALDREHSTLPEPFVKNAVPPFALTKWVSLLFDKVLPWFTFPTVSVSTIQERVHMVVFRMAGICTHKLYLTTYGVYKVAFALHITLSRGMVDKSCLLMFDKDYIFIPKWALKSLHKKLCDLCREHHEYIQMVESEVERAGNDEAVADMPTTTELLESDKGPTLH